MPIQIIPIDNPDTNLTSIALEFREASSLPDTPMPGEEGAPIVGPLPEPDGPVEEPPVQQPSSQTPTLAVRKLKMSDSSRFHNEPAKTLDGMYPNSWLGSLYITGKAEGEYNNFDYMKNGGGRAKFEEHVRNKYGDLNDGVPLVLNLEGKVIPLPKHSQGFRSNWLCDIRVADKQGVPREEYKKSISITVDYWMEMVDWARAFTPRPIGIYAVGGGFSRVPFMYRAARDRFTPAQQANHEKLFEDMLEANQIVKRLFAHVDVICPSNYPFYVYNEKAFGLAFSDMWLAIHTGQTQVNSVYGKPVWPFTWCEYWDGSESLGQPYYRLPVDETTLRQYMDGVVRDAHTAGLIWYTNAPYNDYKVVKHWHQIIKEHSDLSG